MATDRRVIMRTSVLPTARTAYAAVPGSLEEYDISKATYNKNTVSSSIGRLGGNSTLTDITSAQWGDGWSSFISESATWSANLSNWEGADDTWDGIFTMSTTQTQLSSDGSDLQFCYIKNLGSTAVIISLDANSTYPLKLSGGASTMFRGYSSNLKVNEVYVKTASGTSTIEYLIAK
jgi:hypothetical protein